MAKYTSGNQKKLKIGITSFTENQTVLDVVGNVSIQGGLVDSNSSLGDPGYILTSDGSKAQWAPNVGLQGIQGPQGLDGAFAAQGAQGSQGIQGDFGIQGTQGIQGPQGLDGAFAGQGIQG